MGLHEGGGFSTMNVRTAKSSTRRMSLLQYVTKGKFMLELRPTCENCNKALPPNALDARVCSYECTFCADCVEQVLGNVCPNCGGGFEKRPVRPARNWKNDNYLGADPAGATVKHRPVDPTVHTNFAIRIRAIAPEER
jgi:uncharacterized protein